MELEILKSLSRIEEKLDSLTLTTTEKGAKRKCDSLGRVTLPVAVRRSLGIDENTELEVIVINQNIIIRKSTD